MAVQPVLSAISTPLGATSFARQRSVRCSTIHSRRIASRAKVSNVNSHFLGFARVKEQYNFIATKPCASVSQSDLPDGNDEITEMLTSVETKSSSAGSSFLAKLAVAIGVAVTITLVSVYMRQQGSSLTEPSFSFPQILDASSESPVGFTLTLFGKKIILPERTPGWVYFWLLMAAGCGLFISEEALNIWVGISLARSLSPDGTWQSLTKSFSAHAPYVISTVLWVYWGVCISDMIPFYLGKLFRESKASENIYNKLGIGKEKVLSITRVVQKYGNLSGFIERFSLGVRNPTAFLAGVCGVSADCFFAGVCCGGLFTLSLQLAIGFLLRERPVVALASVAAFVGIWTLFPYLIAASTALFIYLRQKNS
ncbi:hypothetical protein LUZ61_011825 [Rhynchospora tenuis]|uniref:Uncharacterized protein n=1 Tax=Rhynchospora tenuis TaxID=198213 RepID=A0AAD6A1U8_9POAL|nr:hypothetical protein LUZ61_011825 [Rhynchospora tenuis]